MKKKNLSLKLLSFLMAAMMVFSAAYIAPEYSSTAIVAQAAKAKTVSISKTKIKVVSAVAYTGKALKPAVKVTYGKKTLKAGKNYTVKYSNNKNIGVGKITITGIKKGGYTGSKTVTFKILPARQKRPYEDYVIEDPEDLDDAPDTGDMFDDDELYDDDDYFAEEKAKTRKGRRRSRHGGISGGVLALLWAVFVILVGVYVYVFFINDKLFTEDITGRDNTVRLEIPDGANYRLCTIDEINQLVNNYLLARAKADQTTLQRLVTDPSEFDDMKSIEISAEYITAYNKTTCYIANGYTADSYIVYELSNLTIKDVTSEPLDIRSLYVTKQSDGSYKINNSALSDKESSYINTINSSGDIQAIYEHVKENNDYLLRTDDTLKKFQSLYN